MSRQWPQKSLHLILLSSALTFSCSRPMTCALEGCTSDNGVILADDLKTEQSADATVQQDDLKTKIKDIYDRLGATEALAALLRETMQLHESRIKTLEDHASGANGRLQDIDARIEKHELELRSQAQALTNMEGALNARIDQQAALQEEALAALRRDLETAESSLTASIESLEEKTRMSIKWILFRMKEERVKREAADAAIAKAAQDNLNALKDELYSEIDELQDADAAMRRELCQEIARLDGRVNGVVVSTEREFRKLWTSYGILQAQILLVSISNAQEHARLRNEIDAVEDKLKKEVQKLSKTDQDLLKDILALKTSQNITQSQLNTLQKRFEDFVKEQKQTHAAIENRFTTITGNINRLKLDLESQIDAEAERINQIMGVLLPQLSGFITDLQTRADSMTTSLTGLQDSLQDQRDDFEDLKTDHANLRTDFDEYASTTSGKLSTLGTMLSNIKSCNLVIKKRGHSEYAELTCGSTQVEFNIK